MNMMRKSLLAFFVTLAFVGGTFFLMKTFQQNNTRPEFATVWPTPLSLPEFNLKDHTNQPIGRSVFNGKWSLVFFGFTHCPDICPATLQQLAIARRRMAETGNEVPEIVLVSVDPERDTAQAMAAYVSHFGDGVTGVTGDLAELRKLTSTAGIYFEKVPGENGAYTVDHSAVVLLINSDAAIHASFGAPHSIESFMQDLPIIMGST